jgi:hypothetical protein
MCELHASLCGIEGVHEVKFVLPPKPLKFLNDNNEFTPIQIFLGEILSPCADWYERLGLSCHFPG